MTLYQAAVRYGQMFQVAEFFTQIADLQRGEACVIRSERGTEVGVVLTAPRPTAEEKAPGEGRLEILRRVDETDKKKLRVLDREGRTREWAFCQERIVARGLAMRLARVEHLFGGDKIVFYYTAENRVDFRNLVKDLAAEFNCKILLRQIGARDEARLLGDYNACGQELCCKTFIKEFAPITMKMAKNQMTTLDPAKITGRCGRLMCCLRYEDETYVELKAQLPQKGKQVRTRAGTGVVTGFDVLAGRVTVALDAGGRSSFPAAEVLRLEKQAGPGKQPAAPHQYITLPPLWQQQAPDATTVYSLVVADCIRRFRLMQGHEVHLPVILARYPAPLQSGLVERGPRGKFRGEVERLLERFSIEPAQIFTTDSPRHQRTVSDFWRRLARVGDLYRQEFRGWQCTRCHRTLRWQGVQREQCLHCGARLEPIDGPCWFFRLSRFQRKLLAAIQTGSEAIKPQLRKIELEQQIKRGLEDTVVARRSFRRGLSVPDDEDFQLAGWFESLLAYVSCLIDEESNPLFYRFWPAQHQLIGPDLLWSHGVIWLAMLLASKVDLPRRLVVHGRWNGPAEEPGWLDALADQLGSDSLRYYLLREVPFGIDGEFVRRQCLRQIGQELGGDLGGLVRRIFGMVRKYCDGAAPAMVGEPDHQLKELLQEVYYEVTGHLERLQFSLALGKLHWAWQRLGGWLEQAGPWRLARDKEQRPELERILYSACESLRILAVLLWPAMPVTAEALQRKLGCEVQRDLGAGIRWGGLSAGSRIDDSIELFPYNESVEPLEPRQTDPQ